MKSIKLLLLTVFILINCQFFCAAQLPGDNKKDSSSPAVNTATCIETSSSLLLNSVKEKDDWQIISGPEVNGVHYPVQASYTKPFPAWEADRYTADSSYFRNCDWLVLPDKKRVINTASRLPIVFVKRFTTNAPSKFKLLVKMLYDNMAYLYIDSNRITLHHPNPDINRFIKEIQPDMSTFVSIPSTFNFSYNASYYAGDFYNLLLPQGNHMIKIELFNNANELGCIIKGILLSDDHKKIFCTAPIEEEQKELESILVFNEKKAFPKNEVADVMYTGLMQTVKSGYWLNNLVAGDQSIIGNDTLFLKKGDKINITPAYITEFRNGNKDTSYTRGSLKKMNTAKAVKKQWDRAFVFDAPAAGVYALEIDCETPVDAKHATPYALSKYARIIKVR